MKVFKVNNKTTRATWIDEIGVLFMLYLTKFPANIYLFKITNRNTRKRCELCSQLTIKIPEPSHWGRSVVFIVNSEHILHLFLVFLLVALNKQMLAGFTSLQYCPYSWLLMNIFLGQILFLRVVCRYPCVKYCNFT